MEKIQIALKFLTDAVKATWVYNVIRKTIKNPTYLILVTAVITLSTMQIKTYTDVYMDEFRRLNAEKVAKEDNPDDHLVFEKIDDYLYTLTGSVGTGDCDRIVPNMPTDFTVILESPGGNLAEGSCIAAHLKLRNVVTVVRNTMVLNAEGKVIYTPGLVGETLNIDHLKNKTVCASACGLMFLGGDKRYLIGDVWFGIHGPGTPDEFIMRMNPKQAESGAYRTASNLLGLLERLGVQDPEVRKLFIQIPNQTMYWLKPNDFGSKPALVKLATNYVNFWGLTTASLDPV
tara:strand:- start:2665 stop:3528 length:864 start_codon:yes stop_codon:yes gene_type:complete